MVSSQGPHERGAGLILVSATLGMILLALESMAVMRVIDFRRLLSTPVFDPGRVPSTAGL